MQVWQKPLIPTENLKTKGQHTDATKNLDYTTIADRSVGVTNHPTGVVTPGLKGTNLPTHRKISVINRTWHGRNIVWNANRLSQRWIHVKKIIKNKMKHFYTIWPYYNNLSSYFVENLDIESRNTHLIIRQLKHPLRTVNCRGNRQNRESTKGYSRWKVE